MTEEFTRSMAELNRKAGEVMLNVGVRTATDITGFGLIGHLHEVLSASGCRARLQAGAVPFFDDAVRLVGLSKVPGGTVANIRSFEPFVQWDAGVSETEKVLLNDAQTSGGLLMFVPGEKKELLLASLKEADIPAATIGDVMKKTAGAVEIIVGK